VEAGLTATLGLAGIGAREALLATLIYRLAAYWAPLVMGGVAYVLHQRRYGDGMSRHGRPRPVADEENG
jgi:uncharacterized membrane protein YbhN (UPF0104 family)